MARTSEKDAGPKPRNDAYTGLLAISFLALVGATVLMALDADELGNPPKDKLKIDVPGVTAGKAGEALRRPDTGKIDTTDPKPGDPVPMPMPMPMPKPPDPGMMMRNEPGRLPGLAEVDVPAVTVPVSADSPADPSAPPLPVKPFVPPM